MTLDPSIEYEYEYLQNYPDQEAVIEYLLAAEPKWDRNTAIRFMNPIQDSAFEKDVFTDEDPPPNWEELKRTTSYA